MHLSIIWLHCVFQLRFLQNKPSQLIAYERDDKAGPKMSEYHVATTDKPDELANVLIRALGEKGRKSTNNNNNFPFIC